jgi:filamentous hemagglutinin family protein
MQIDQHSDKVQLNWQTFNIGRENTVRFNQPSSTSAALNRVYDPNANPSRILGNLIANGQVYLINRNGIVFGEGAKVDVNSLVASTLDVDPDLFELGLSQAIDNPGPKHAFEDSLALVHIADENGDTVRFRVDAQGEFVVDEEGRLIIDPDGEPYPIFIKVEKGAQINGGKHGSVMVFAPNIENDGEIIVPDGQAILAAGNRIYLQTNNELRGFLVEVDSDAVSTQDLETYISAVNDAADNGDGADNPIGSLVMGNIINRGTVRTDRGNINLVGLAINQEGTLSATTAVNANGRIRLMARDSVDVQLVSGVSTMRTSRTGHIRLGENSTTEILPDSETADKGEVDVEVNGDASAPVSTDIEYYRSAVELMARTIEMDKYSEINVPSGGVFIDAIKDPTRDMRLAQQNTPILKDDSTAIRMAEHSRINVAGVETELSMERNIVEVELRGNELADSPLQRDGTLQGQKARIDIRTLDENGSIPIANVKGALNNIKRTIGERSTSGGGVVLRSLGNVTMDKNVTIDVSGGAINYQGGYINTTHVVSNGKIVEISEADPNMIYDHIEGQVVRSNSKWNTEQRWVRGGRLGYFEPAYTEGKDAGIVQINAYNPQIWGNLVGRTTPGRYQRDLDSKPRGGELIIGDPGGQNENSKDWANYIAPHVVLTGQDYIDNLTDLMDQGLQPKNENLLFLSTGIFESNGFDRLKVYSNGIFLLNENLALNPGGALEVRAREIEIAADIGAPGGRIDLLARDWNNYPDPSFDFQLRKSNTSGAVANFLKLNDADLAEVVISDNASLVTEGLWTNDSPYNPVNGLNIDYSAPTIFNGGDISVKLESQNGVARIGDNVTIDASGGAWLQSNGKYTAGRGGDITINLSPDSHFSVGENLNLKSFSLAQGGSLQLTFPEIVVSPGGSSLPGGGAGLGQRQDNLIDNDSADILADRLLENYNTALRTLRSESGNPDIAFEDINKEQLAGLMFDAWGALGTPPDINVSPQVIFNEFLKPLSENAAPDRDSILASINDLNMVNVPVSLFQSGGFSNYSINANAGNLILTEGISIQPRSYNYIVANNFKNQPNNLLLSDFADPVVLPDHLRPPVSLELSAVISQLNSPLPVLEVPDSVSIETEPLAFVTMSTNGRLLINGDIKAPGGAISLLSDFRFSRLTGSEVVMPFDPDRGVVLSPTSHLSVAGVAQLQPNEENLLIGEIYDGGDIAILSQGGFADLEAGAQLNVSGTTETIDVLTPVHVDQDGQATGGRYERRELSSNAGSISVSASEGLRILSDMQASVGDKKATGGTLNVTLNSRLADAFSFNEPRESFGYTSTENTAWTLLIGSLSSDSTAPSTGPDLPPLESGNGSFAVDQLQSSGFDSLALSSSDTLQFDNRVDIDMGRSISVASSLIEITDTGSNGVGEEVRLNAPHVVISGADGVPGAVPVTAGPEKLLVGGDNTYLVELTRNMLLQNVDTFTVHSLGDVRLRGSNSGVSVNGDINIRANQLYAATQSDFTLLSMADDGVINIERTDVDFDPVPVLSAGSKITLQANIINQGGVVKAPLGEIDMVGANDNTPSAVNLLEGSVTQTAADVELVPFGETSQGGNTWNYTAAGGANNRTIYTTKGYGSAPEQHLSLTADSVEVDPQAVVDISGGGELVGFEFVKGPGGSKDVTSAAVAQSENTYALLPWLQNSYAPYDANIYEGWDIEPGLSFSLDESVAIKDGANQFVTLEAGEYPLLPARYALLPGAVLVTAQPGYQNLPSGLNLQTLDGAPIVSGRVTTMNTTLQDQLAGGFVVRSGNYAHLRSEIRETSLSNFLTQKQEIDTFILPRLPGDAGVLSLDATDQITLEGTFMSAPQTIKSAGASGTDYTGMGADVDISTSSLRIVREKSGATDAVELTGDELQRLAAESLLLGGARTIGEKQSGDETVKVTNIDSTAENIVFADGVELTAPEIILATKGSDPLQATEPNILLQSGSALRSSGEINRPARDIVLDGDGAMVRVSQNSHIDIQRSNVGTNDATVVIETGAQIASSSSIIVESSQDVALEGDISAGGGSITFGANQINLGHTGNDGLNLTADFINSLADNDSDSLSLNQLILVSPNAIALSNSVGLDNNGNPFINDLILQSPGLVATDDALDSVLAANNITFNNAQNIEFTGASTNDNNNQLNVIAGQAQQTDTNPAAGNIKIEGGLFTIDGFDMLNITADREIVGAGNGGIDVDGSINMTAQRMTVATGADLNISANTGSNSHAITYSLPGQSNMPPLPEVQSLGGKVTISGSSVDIDAPIIAPSGSIDIYADGVNGDVRLGGNAHIDVAGRTKLMGDEILISSWGGDVTIKAENGLAILESGSLIDVSGATPNGSAAGNDAGSIAILSGGPRRIDNSNPANPTLIENSFQGTLLANAQDGFRKGSFVLDINNYIDSSDPAYLNLDASDLNDIEDFRALNRMLNDGQFNESRDIRFRHGDMTVAGDGSPLDIIAHNLTLTADQGAIDLANTLIDATGTKGGRVEFYARDDIAAHGTSYINASATAYDPDVKGNGGEDGEGGTVLLSSETGAITIAGPDNEQGAVINVGGSKQLLDYQGEPLLADGQPVMADGKVHFRVAQNNVSTLDLGDTVTSISGAKTIDVEAFKVYDDSELPASVNGQVTIDRIFVDGIAAETQDYMLNSAPALLDAINQMSDSSIDDRIRIMPGVEIKTGDALALNVESGWDLYDWKYGSKSVPGVLSIRSGGALDLQSSLTDGYFVEVLPPPRPGLPSTERQRLDTRESWSYQLTSGADINSVNPHSMLYRSDAHMTLASGTTVRTGTGDIDIHIAGDLKLADSSSTIFTSGIHTLDGQVLRLPRFPFTELSAGARFNEFPENGGDIRIAANGSIVSETIPEQMVVPWMWRQGGKQYFTTPVNTEWAIDVARFEQGIAAFGGGDIDIEAGADIENVSFSIPTTGIQTGADTSDLTVFGGGDLTVQAGGDFKGGGLFANAGDIHLQAGGGLRKNEEINPKPTFIIMGDGSATVNANRDIVVGSVVSPMLLPRSAASLGINGGNFVSFFASYTEDAEVNINSLAGDVTMQPKTASGLQLLYPDSFGSTATLSGYLSVYAPTLHVNAFNGDIAIKNNIVLFPSQKGDLTLIAENDVATDQILYMSDANPLSQPSPTRPHTEGIVLDAKALQDEHNPTPLHLGDHNPVYIIANTGNITGKFKLAEQARVIAGNDIQDVDFQAQHVQEEDYSVFYAGRDIRFNPDNNVKNRIEIFGPGRLDLLAKRHIDLGGAAGIATLGNLQNPALPDSGADIIAMAGIGDGVDYQQFMADYLKVHLRQPAFTQSLRDLSGNQQLNDGSALAYFEEHFSPDSAERMVFLQQLNISEQDVQEFHDIVTFDRQSAELAQQVQNELNKTALTPLDAYHEYTVMSDAQKQEFEQRVGMESRDIDRLGASLEYQHDAVAKLNKVNGVGSEPVVTKDTLQQFARLSSGEQRPVIIHSFFTELRESGRYASNTGSQDYSRGFDSISSLFPDINNYDGNLTMYASRIYTLDGGDIDLLVPGGMVNGGLAQSTKKANKLGVVAQREGSINTFTDGNYIVNQSRVFTLFGGDILMWSSYGDIDAGRGAKTAVSAPEPNVSFDVNGNVVIDFAGAINGSGIRAIATGDVDAGDVDLFAINGIVDAGDAGIAGANVTIGAREVVGAENIEFNVAVGVPTGNASLAGSLSGVSDVASSASKSAEETVASTSESATTDTPVADAALSYLEVFVIGLGDEQSSDDDNGNSRKDNN